MLLLIPAGVVTLRRVRDRLPRTNQRWHELRQSVLAAIVFSLVGLGVYHGAQHGLFRVYSEAAQYGWAYWAASLVLVIVAHDAYFYWAHRWMHRPSVFRRVHRTHHLSVAPTQWAAYSFSAGEAALQAAFLPLFLLVVPTHATVLSHLDGSSGGAQRRGSLRCRARTESMACDVVGAVVYHDVAP